MSEKSTFAKPLSAAIGKATGVFTRPKLQRRAFTAHAASELISAASLSSVLLDLKENGTKIQDKEPEPKPEEEKTEGTEDPVPNVITVLSHRLSTCDGTTDSKPKTEGKNVYEPRRKSDTAISNQNINSNNNKIVSKDKNFASLNCLRVKDIISETLKAHVGNMEYDHRECGDKCRVMSQIIEKRVKAMNNSLYKVTVMVFIGAIRDEGIDLATQCIWSPTEDYFAMATYKNDTVFASGIAFATIFE